MKLAKRSSIDKQILKDLIYGCIKELGQNQDFYYHSNFGSKYSHLTQKGEKACIPIFEEFVHKVLEAEEAEYQERRKRETFDALKNDTNKDDSN